MSDEDGCHICVARLDGRDRVFFLDTHEDSEDHVLVDDGGFIVAFDSELDARRAMGTSDEEAAHYDIDGIEAWCHSGAPAVDCDELLSFWNLVTDVPERGDLFRAADRQADAIYDKLFAGLNLFPMPNGEHYVPSWGATELALLKRLLLLGVAELRSRFR